MWVLKDMLLLGALGCPFFSPVPKVFVCGEGGEMMMGGAQGLLAIGLQALVREGDWGKLSTLGQVRHQRNECNSGRVGT